MFDVLLDKKIIGLSIIPLVSSCGGSNPEPPPVELPIVEVPEIPTRCRNEQYAIVSVSDDGSFDAPYELFDAMTVLQTLVRDGHL